MCTACMVAFTFALPATSGGQARDCPGRGCRVPCALLTQLRHCLPRHEETSELGAADSAAYYVPAALHRQLGDAAFRGTKRQASSGLSRPLPLQSMWPAAVLTRLGPCFKRHDAIGELGTFAADAAAYNVPAAMHRQLGAIALRATWCGGQARDRLGRCGCAPCGQPTAHTARGPAFRGPMRRASSVRSRPMLPRTIWPAALHSQLGDLALRAT
jgi:hypothetical protein